MAQTQRRQDRRSAYDEISPDEETASVLEGLDVEQLLTAHRNALRRFTELSNAAASNPDLLGNIDPETGKSVHEINMDVLANSAVFIEKRLLDLGLDTNGRPKSDEQLQIRKAELGATYVAINQRAAEAAARIESDRLDREARVEQANKDRLQRRDELAAETANERRKDVSKRRGDDITAIVDLYSQDIALGNLKANEARDKAKAAFDAASIQRDILSDHAGKALPAGAAYFPNLGPTGAVANVAKALGVNFGGIETGGTYVIDPNAIAAPIMAAQAGPSAAPSPAAVDAVRRALTGLGVPAGVGV